MIPKTFGDIFDAIDESLQKERIIPALILVYSAIDNFSNLAQITEKASSAAFKEWVKKWMLSKYPLPCTEVDIWSARCGLLHQQISESDMTAQGKAKQIYYAHGGADPEKLQVVIELAGRDAVTLILEDLINSFKNGMTDCMNEIERNPEWKKSFDLKATKLFVSSNPFV